jgi:ankyrin repeat protein
MEQTPLFTVRLPTFFMAARDGHVDAVRAFVGAGAVPSTTGMRRWTALILAASARRSSILMLQYLLDHGANVNATDDAGRSVLDWALTRGETEVSAFLQILLFCDAIGIQRFTGAPKQIVTKNCVRPPNLPKQRSARTGRCL